MKRWIAILCAALMLLSCVAFAADDADKVLTLVEGKYIIGEDIEPGTYMLTCVETSGEKLGSAYGALGKAMDALDGGSAYGNLMNALGGMMEEVVEMTVEILGDYGDVLKEYSLKSGESITIRLKTETALQITDGSCTLKAE